MDTYVIAKRDADERVYTGIVIAPDHTTALRVFAREMLEELGTSLADCREPSLASYADVSYLDEDWTAAPGKACPCCSSHDVRPMREFEMARLGVAPPLHLGRCHTCATCAHVWIDVGQLADVRRELEREADLIISGLDDYEKNSLLEEV